jgi:hypothetical protein
MVESRRSTSTGISPSLGSSISTIPGDGEHLLLPAGQRARAPALALAYRKQIQNGFERLGATATDEEANREVLLDARALCAPVSSAKSRRPCGT